MPIWLTFVANNNHQWCRPDPPDKVPFDRMPKNCQKRYILSEKVFDNFSQSNVNFPGGSDVDPASSHVTYCHRSLLGLTCSVTWHWSVRWPSPGRTPQTSPVDTTNRQQGKHKSNSKLFIQINHKARNKVIRDFSNFDIIILIDFIENLSITAKKFFLGIT